MNKANFNYFLIAATLICSNVCFAQDNLVTDIEQLKTVVNNELDEASVKFASDTNISEKKKRQCMNQLKKVLSIKQSSKRDVKNDDAAKAENLSGTSIR